MKTLYGNPEAEEAFGPAEALRFSWTSAMTTAANGSATPSLETLASNPDTLVRFSTTASGATSGFWWTSIGSVVDQDGALLSPGQIQEVLALPQTPAYMGIGGVIPAGTTAIYGSAASNSFGPGGAMQILSEVAAAAEGGVVELEGLAGALDKRRSASPKLRL